MQTTIYFGMSAMLGLVAWFTIFGTFVWPKLKALPKAQQLRTLTALHFFRYFGTTFLIVGLVTRKLPAGFADPAAVGDMVALLLAYAAFVALRNSSASKVRTLPSWIFNIVGAADLLLAAALGPVLMKNVGDFGVTYFIPTFYVPLLLVAHFYAFKVLTQRVNLPDES